MTIAILLVAANLKAREKAFNSFIEGHAMLSEFVALEVILKIRWSKPTPIDHGSSYRAVTAFEIRYRPNGLALTRGAADDPIEQADSFRGAVGCSAC